MPKGAQTPLQESINPYKSGLLTPLFIVLDIGGLLSA